MTNGVRNMASYRHLINENDRWAIVSYIRALQESQNTNIDQVPEQHKNNLR